MPTSLLVCLTGLAVATHAQVPCNVSVVVTSPTCPDDLDGSIAVVPNTPGLYTYFWQQNPALQDSIATGLAAGPYSVFVTDTSGCFSQIDTVVVPPVVAPLGTITTTNITCAGLDDGTLTISTTTFISNTSGSNGGAVGSRDQVTILNSTFTGNSCSRSDCRGGALGTSGQSANVLFSTFNANEAGGVGGALAVVNNGVLTVANSTLSGNTAAVAGGGLFGGEDSQTTLVNVTLAGNSAAAGGGLYVELFAQIGLTNTLLANNTLQNCGGQLDFGTWTVETVPSMREAWRPAASAMITPAAGKM